MRAVKYCKRQEKICLWQNKIFEAIAELETFVLHVYQLLVVYYLSTAQRIIIMFIKTKIKYCQLL